MLQLGDVLELIVGVLACIAGAFSGARLGARRR